MTYTQASKIIEQNKERLIGQQWDGRENWLIKDLIACPAGKAAEVYQIMWEWDKSNEDALKMAGLFDADCEIFKISHQWPWGSGDLLVLKFIVG